MERKKRHRRRMEDMRRIGDGTMEAGGFGHLWWWRGIENQHTRTRFDCHSMQISDNQYLKKSSRMLDRSESFWRWSNDGSKNQCIDLGIIYVNNDETISSPWAKLQQEFVCVQENHFRRAQDVVRHYTKVDLGTWIRDYECSHDWICKYMWQIVP